MFALFQKISDDATLCAHIAEGGILQEKALSQINRHYKGIIEDLLKKHPALLRDWAEEAYDDALLAIRDNIVGKKFKGDCTLKTYFYRIFQNKCIDKLRSRSTIVQMDDSMLEKVAAHMDTIEQQEERALEERLSLLRKGCLEKALWVLSDKERDLLTDILVEGIKPKEAAVKYGYKDNQVASQTIYKAKEKLKKSIEHLCATDPDCKILCQPGKRITLI